MTWIIRTLSKLTHGGRSYYPPMADKSYCVLSAKMVFVAGTNLQGRHGAGAALIAKRFYGLKEGVGAGPSGRSYGIPTRRILPGQGLVTLPLSEIEKHAHAFVDYTEKNPHLTFLVTPIGTGHAGYKHDDIAPFFLGAVNCWLPVQWRKYLDPQLEGLPPEKVF